ncbi:MAG: hypothetical protein AABY10_03380 [Nanoarchaeota archaeon]
MTFGIYWLGVAEGFWAMDQQRISFGSVDLSRYDSRVEYRTWRGEQLYDSERHIIIALPLHGNKNMYIHDLGSRMDSLDKLKILEMSQDTKDAVPIGQVEKDFQDIPFNQVCLIDKMSSKRSSLAVLLETTQEDFDFLRSGVLSLKEFSERYLLLRKT